jgi:hypothetical protein
MQWFKRFCCVGCLLILFFVLFGVSSCGSMRKTKTVIETVTKIDTVIVIKPDTVIKTVQVYFHDSARIENNYSIARSYYSPEKQKIVLTLQAKPFSVLVTMTHHKIEKIKEVIRKPSLSSGLIIAILFFVFGFAAYYGVKNVLKL